MTDRFDDPPRAAAWRHCGARNGFEVVFATPGADGWRFDGSTTAVELGSAWHVDYTIDVARSWATLRVHLVARSETGGRELVLERDVDGRWCTNGRRMPAVDGCADVDLESSAFTNLLPVRRLGLAPGETAHAPAVFVRAVDLTVECLEQTYTRLADEAGQACFRYRCPTFGADIELRFDRSGLVTEYPGLAVRIPLLEC